jgi:hypothetical protein
VVPYESPIKIIHDEFYLSNFTDPIQSPMSQRDDIIVLINNGSFDRCTIDALHTILEPITEETEEWAHRDTYVNNVDLYIEKRGIADIYWIQSFRAFLGGPLIRDDRMVWLIFMIAKDYDDGIEDYAFNYDTTVSALNKHFMRNEENLLEQFLYSSSIGGLTNYEIENDDEVSMREILVSKFNEKKFSKGMHIHLSTENEYVYLTFGRIHYDNNMGIRNKFYY